MDITTSKPSSIVRFFAATLVTVAIIVLSALAMHAPMQKQSPVTLKSIQTDRVALYADALPSCAWFVEMVLPTADSELMSKNLKSVAAKL
jgi:hypothetical protein